MGICRLWQTPRQTPRQTPPNKLSPVQGMLGGQDTSEGHDVERIGQRNTMCDERHDRRRR